MVTKTSIYGELLNAYVLDYLKKKGFLRTAREFAEECRQMTAAQHKGEAASAEGAVLSPPGSPPVVSELPAVPIDSPCGFLSNWWTVFWECFATTSAPRRSSDSTGGALVSDDMLAFVQHQAQTKPLHVRRTSTAMVANINGRRRASR
ncbi:hypothetical protein GGI02_000958, partial [Coemansia sp. RSA 2322]